MAADLIVISAAVLGLERLGRWQAGTVLAREVPLYKIQKSKPFIILPRIFVVIYIIILLC